MLTDVLYTQGGEEGVRIGASAPPLPKGQKVTPNSRVRVEVTLRSNVGIADLNNLNC